jgi:hypothetical protein
MNGHGMVVVWARGDDESLAIAQQDDVGGGGYESMDIHSTGVPAS